MVDLNNTNFDYFEADQLKHAVQLWKANKKAGGLDFDVLRFSREWSFAETVLAQSLIADDSAVAACALELMQLRLIFFQRHPARAQKIGAPGADALVMTGGASASRAAPAPVSPEEPPDPEPPKQRYLKGIR